MLSQISNETINALAQLDGNVHFEIVKRWLQESLHELDRTTPITKDEVQTRWNQGAQQVLNEILDKAVGAEQAIRKIRSRQ